jgi:hypothetical protein
VIHLTRDENGRFVNNDIMTQAIIRYRENRPGTKIMRAMLDLDAIARREAAKNGA